ncbi:MAG: hypothetical protein JW867_05685, partial [Candidatus Omnitrophica bacterium]|nr:hypothetical protein [Candidatus Omnitrophota bacterium]
NIEDISDSALLKIKARFQLVDAWFYREKLNQALKAKDLEDIFFVKDGDVFCEREVVAENGDSRRIDRLIVKIDQVWIVDYKSSLEAEKKGSDQVREYKQIISSIYPKQKVRGFLVYLDSFTMSEV